MLKILPCLDSAEMADNRRFELDIPWNHAEQLGISAVAAMDSGFYHLPGGRKISWGDLVDSAVGGKISIPPEASLPGTKAAAFAETTVQVANETTQGAARRLINTGDKPLALNFANGVNPGGGFLHGARAQEEALCRTSALFATLREDPMYAFHRDRGLSDSTDWAILSPDVPVFRTDEGLEIERPWLLSFLTCAAPYAPEIGISESAALLKKRIRRILAIARAYDYTALILGAWGCGAFGNDPQQTAADFRDALENEFDGSFLKIVFAISDWSENRVFLGPFRDVFSRR